MLFAHLQIRILSFDHHIEDGNRADECLVIVIQSNVADVADWQWLIAADHQPLVFVAEVADHSAVEEE